MKFSRPRRAAVVAPLLVLAASACDHVPAVLEPEAVSEASAVRTAPFHAGVYLGEEATTPERIRNAIHSFTSQVGAAPAWVKSYHTVDADLSPVGWAGRVVREIAGTGATNYVGLDLDWRERPAGSLLDAIVAGAGDDHFTHVARSLRELNGVVLVEPAWEMNGDWQYAWQGAQNGSNSAAPAKFVKAWQRMVDVFRASGADNVRFIFNPNVGNAVTGGSGGRAHWNWWGNYYPGDDYVDFVGAHGFNGPRVWSTAYQSFDDVFFGRDSDNILADMKASYPDKPIIIGELATEEIGDKAAWIRDAYASMHRDPRIVGAVWFHMKKEADWRIDSSASSLEAYRAAVRAPAVVVSNYLTSTNSARK